MTLHSASVTVEFGGDSSEQGYTWEEDPLKTEDPTVYAYGESGVTGQAIKKVWLRLSPLVGSPQVQATAGFLTYWGTGSDRKRTTLTFSGDDSQTLGLDLTDVSFSVVGSTFSKGAGSITVSFTYDKITGEVRASQPCFAVVNVSYKYSYRSYLYNFSGSCPAPHVSSSTGGIYTGVEVEEEPPFKSAVVWALDVETGRMGTYNLTGPSCTYEDPEKGGGVGKNYPSVYIESVWSGLQGSSSSIVTPVTIFNVWPAEAEIFMEGGTYSESFPKDSEIDIMVNFDGETASLPRLPMNIFVDVELIWAEASPNDKGGNYPTPSRVATPRDQVLVVEWKTSSSYIVKSVKTVGLQELVLCTGGGVMVPGRALARVRYTATYKTYKGYHETTYKETEAGIDLVAKEIFVSGFYKDGTGSTSLPGPGTKDRANPTEQP